MAEGVNEHDTKPNKLPPMRHEEVMARAQRILDLRGRPPYTEKTGVYCGYEGEDVYPYQDSQGRALSPDELAILSDFVYHWLPFLVEKEKAKT